MIVLSVEAYTYSAIRIDRFVYFDCCFWLCDEWMAFANATNLDKNIYFILEIENALKIWWSVFDCRKWAQGVIFKITKKRYYAIQNVGEINGVIKTTSILCITSKTYHRNLTTFILYHSAISLPKLHFSRLDSTQLFLAPIAGRTIKKWYFDLKPRPWLKTICSRFWKHKEFGRYWRSPWA